MGGIRISFTVLFFISVWTVLANLSSAHQSQVIVTKQSVVRGSESKDENRCMALLRRTVIRKELLTYPCFHPVPGVVPIVAHQTNMGLVCRGYTNTPSTQYIRLPTCCPGSQPDETGRCVTIYKAEEHVKESQPQPQQKKEQPTETKRLEDLEKYPASYEKKRQQVIGKLLSQPQHWAPHPMIMRRIDAILKQRQHFLQQMQQDMSSKTPMSPAAVINGLFSTGPHPSLGHPQTVPEIPRPSQQAEQETQQPMHFHQSGPSIHRMHHEMPDAFHTALHNHNIPHSHDSQGNPEMHSLKQNANEAFAQQQYNMQMAAKKNMQISRQQQLLQLQQQRQQALEMRQRMLQFRRMQQAQSQQHQQMMMQQARNAASQSHREMPLVPRPQQHTPAQSYVIQRQFSNENEVQQFPNIPRMRSSVFLAVSPNTVQHYIQQTTVQRFPNIPSEHMMQYNVQLPRIPVESPPVNVQPGPNSPFHIPPPPPCFAKYLMVVRKCFNDANIEIPSDHNMFNVNFNYNGVCRKREIIMSCIFHNLHPCNTIQEQALIRSTIGHTVDEINRVCQIGQINGIEERLAGKEDSIPMIPDHAEPTMDDIQQEPEPRADIPIIPEDHHAMSLGQHTVHVHAQNNAPEISVVPEKPQKNVELPQPEPKTVDQKPAITISEHEDGENQAIGTAHAHTDNEESHEHEHGVHVMELEEEQYYLPILIGTAIGVAGIFILLLAIVCICCRRRLKKKIYLQKETEKPKLFDVYTIGVPPPVYEVNGIPPISYEEAKGEKFTGSPSSVRRHNAENESQQETRSVSGVVSDI